MVASTLLMVALIGLVALLGGRLLPPQPIELHITLLEEIDRTQGGDTPLLLRLDLTNPSGEAQSLARGDSCHMDWLLLSPNGRLLQAGKREDCARFFGERLASYESQSEEMVILIKRDLLKTGEIYFLHMRVGDAESQMDLSF